MVSRYLVTSALPYINGIKHIGNLVGSMLPADVHARFRRLQGHEVLLICATDEHGTPAELAARDAGLPVDRYCDEQHEQQADVYRRFDLSFDWFGRSSSVQNRELTLHFAMKLEENGYIDVRSTKQLFSPEDQRFLPDRYVEGTCPHCGNDRARGDQCDNCGRLLDAVDLIAPRSKISVSADLELRETTHLFLLQSKLSPLIRQWVDGCIDWPHLARSIAHKWLDEGLKDRAITRDMSWGVPVLKDGKPREGFENKVYYVWFDAPIEYLAATWEWSVSTGGDWERWWRTDRGADDVEYVQFMGKDNVAFHTVSFPGTIIGSGEPWKLVDRLKAFNWLTWYGGKFSTSERQGIFMDTALELMDADYWRWYLLANAPESADVAFTWDGFRSCVNSDLADVLGNFVNRITRFCRDKYSGQVPPSRLTELRDQNLINAVNDRLSRLTTYHEQTDFRKACIETRSLWSLGNEYLSAAAPWTMIRSDPDDAAAAVRLGLELCLLFADITEPLLPTTAGRIRDLFEGARPAGCWPTKFTGSTLSSDVTIRSSDVLFRKISEEELQDWKDRF